MDKGALALTIIGALNWGMIALFRFDFVAFLFDGQLTVGARIVYGVIALAGLWCVSLLFRKKETA